MGMDECELIYIITTIACAISKCCGDDEISLMAAAFTQLGDTLATIMVKRERINSNHDNTGNSIEDKNQPSSNVESDFTYNNCKIFYKDIDYHNREEASDQNPAALF